MTRVVGNRQEYIGNYHTQAVENIDSETKVGYVTNQNVNSFAGYNGYNNGVFDENKTLYFLQQDLNTSVVVRIWLEGGDPLCDDEISSSTLNIGLQFDNIEESEVA